MVTANPPPSVAPRWLRAAAVAVATIGLAASVALLIDYLRPVPTFCAEAGGCASVRASAWSHPLGVPMPTAGIAFFALAIALAVMPRLQRLLPWLAAAGAAVAIGLLLVQGLLLGTWCKLCVVTDSSALAFAATVAVMRRRPWPALRRPRRALAAAFAATGAAVLLPLAVAHLAPPPVAAPPSPAGLALSEIVAREQRPGVVTVVDFIDFECPFCRLMHQRLTAALAAVAGDVDVPVRIVRKMVPIERIHPHAMAAALAWCCGEAQGAGDAMAEALFTAPPAQLDTAGCERLAASLGSAIDLTTYRTCIAAPETRARVVADLAEARAAGVRSLPTIYIGNQPFLGADASQSDLEAALRRAAGRPAGT